MAATQVHHRVEVHVDPSREFDPGNCEPICDEHHEAHHCPVPEPVAGQAAFDAQIAALESSTLALQGDGTLPSLT